VLGGATGVTTVAAGATYVVLGLAGAGAVVSAWTQAAKPSSAARSQNAYRMTVSLLRQLARWHQPLPIGKHASESNITYA
jgi:hypothetical protein